MGSVVRRILIVDDHPIVCEGIGKLLAGHGDLEICGSAADVTSALSAVEQLRPDVALVDLSLGSSSGLQLIEMLARDNYPTVLTLALSMHDEALYAKRVLQAGGRGQVTTSGEQRVQTRDARGSHEMSSSCCSEVWLVACTRPRQTC